MQSCAQAGLVQCPELWFPDGNIVLQAGNTVFCVYKGVLSMKSTFFQGLFSLPPTPDQDMYEDLPVVQCHDDVEDLKTFLLALFDSDFSDEFFQQQDTILRLLKLSNKYDAPNLRRRLIRLLEPTFPTTLDAFQAIYSTGQKLFRGGGDLVSFIAVAQDAAPFFLPAAYTLLSHCAELHVHLKPDGPGAAVFDSDRQAVFFRARAELDYTARRKVYPAVFRHPCVAGDAACSLGPTRRYQNIFDIAPHGFASPFYPRSMTGERCSACSAEWPDENHPRMVEYWWGRLPKLFGLPSWEVLVKDKEDALHHQHSFESLRSVQSIPSRKSKL